MSDNSSFEKKLNSGPSLIINLQGDMPNINPETINNLITYMKKGQCEIGTLAGKLKSNYELADENVVKVLVKEKLKEKMDATEKFCQTTYRFNWLGTECLREGSPSWYKNDHELPTVIVLISSEGRSSKHDITIKSHKVV